jgi:hypothetical protein
MDMCFREISESLWWVKALIPAALTLAGLLLTVNALGL